VGTDPRLASGIIVNRRAKRRSDETMQTKHELIKAKIAEVEREMKQIGYWQSEPPAPGAIRVRSAFAVDTMAFSQWLQFIFIPRVVSIVDTGGEFPAKSSVGAQAGREFDGDDKAARLVESLCELDALVERRPVS
jgi:uncharacterized protein YqcC (DUF446 family)